MKKIFVTVKDFIANGGKLEHGRQLYKKKHANAIAETLGWYVGDADKDGMITVGNIGSTFPYYSNQAFVQIDCTPIYV